MENFATLSITENQLRRIFKRMKTVQISLIRPLSLMAILSCGLLLLSSCNRSTTSASETNTKRYPFTGRVVSIDTQAQSAMINGDDIPGFMDAMTMEYKIKPPSMLSQLAAGDSISAQVVVVEPKNKNDEWQ